LERGIGKIQEWEKKENKMAYLSVPIGMENVGFRHVSRLECRIGKT
jgi:hypothetical protein